MISIIIVACSDQGDYALPLIDSILFYDEYVDIILIDNASKKAYKKSPLYELVRMDEPVGYSRALNIGASKVKDGWLVFLNDDVMCINNFTDTITNLDKWGLYGMNKRIKKANWGCGTPIHYLHGWIQVMHMDTYKAIGPFDENLKYFGMDDIDYGWRASQLEIPIISMDLPFMHMDMHRRMKQEGFEEKMKASKEYFIKKVNSGV